MMMTGLPGCFRSVRGDKRWKLEASSTRSRSECTLDPVVWVSSTNYVSFSLPSATSCFHLWNIRTQPTLKELSRDNVELWLVRVPKEFDRSMLSNQKIKIREKAKPGDVVKLIGEVVDAPTPIKPAPCSHYELQVSDPTACQELRVMAYSKKRKSMACAKPFTRHLSVVQVVDADQKKDEQGEGESGGLLQPVTKSEQLGEEASPAVRRMIIPYEPPAQVADLGVRFKPAGAGTGREGDEGGVQLVGCLVVVFEEGPQSRKHQRQGKKDKARAPSVPPDHATVSPAKAKKDKGKKRAREVEEGEESTPRREKKAKHLPQAAEGERHRRRKSV